MPDRYHFASLEIATSLSALGSQYVPSLVLKESPIPELAKIAYVIFGTVVYSTLRYYYLKNRDKELQIQKVS